MLTELALKVPGFGKIDTPIDVPTGGLTRANDILTTGVQFAFVIGAVIALFLLVWSGIQWITSSGEKEKLAAARKRITYTIVGLFIVVFSVFFVNLILLFFSSQYLGQSNVDKPTNQNTGCGKTLQKPCEPTSSDKDGCSSPLDIVIRGKCVTPGG